jgi:hypothetical protein
LAELILKEATLAHMVAKLMRSVANSNLALQYKPWISHVRVFALPIIGFCASKFELLEINGIL